ncbi:Spy/CpxP family protein refolding chaperone [Thalassotalea sp. PLHSN55]|uniref:Spy/CpxP family protein refolding chaperone n=1 Tax=Thalassotalea sp. PLHSN55 TaxID=3435888 RepID=UPI003F853785
MSIIKASKLKPLVIALSTSAILLTSTISIAESDMRGMRDGAHHHHGHELKRMSKALDLTDEQRTQIKDILSRAKETREASKAENQATKEAFKLSMKAIMEAEEFNESDFVNLHQENQQTFLAAKVEKAKVKHAVLQVLTQEQKDKWMKIKSKFKKRGNKHRTL